MDAAELLLQTTLFRDLSVPDVEQLLSGLTDRTYGKGQAVWRQGDAADVLAIVADGQLKAHRFNTDGREVIVTVVTPYGMTGEVGLFHPAGSRWFDLTAMTPARVLLIRRAPLLNFMTRHPAAMQRLLESLSVTAVNAANMFSGMAFDDISHRVARLLLTLAAAHGEETPDGLRIAPRLSQGEFAAHIAASRENVNRALAGLVARGLVSHIDGHFYIHDRDALELAANAL